MIRKKDIDLSKKVNGVFKKITWTVILIFPISGFLNIYLKTNITTVLELLKNSKNLQLKIFIYFTILILKYLHDFFGKRALQNPTFFTLTIILGRINFILGIIMIVLGVLISRGYY